MEGGGFVGEPNVALPASARAPGHPGRDLPLPPVSQPATGHLRRIILEYDPKADIGLIESAYALAAQAHSTQRRDNGEPYITHPLAVATILAGYHLDIASIATALLHDVIEDTSYKLADIQTGFGKEIAGLVDGVTKLTRLELQSDR